MGTDGNQVADQFPLDRELKVEAQRRTRFGVQVADQFPLDRELKVPPQLQALAASLQSQTNSR